MTLENTLNDLLKQAMRDKDSQTSNVIRMLKTKLTERRTAKGFTGTVDDALILDVIAAYRKTCQKALAEFEALTPPAQEHIAGLRFEITFCERFLPKGLDEATLRVLVKERIAALGLKSQKEMGKLLGDLMKSHKGQIEAVDVKQIAAETLPV